MMRTEAVERRQWMSAERFVDLIGVTNLIPGPSSTELAIYLGYLRAGWLGLVVAGICFIGPAMLIVLALAWAYVTYGALPQVNWLFYGIQPVVVAIIAQAIFNLGRTIFKAVQALIVALLVLVLYFLGINVLVLLFGGALFYGLVRLMEHRWKQKPQLHSLLLPVGLSVPGKLALPTSVSGLLAAGVPFSFLLEADKKHGHSSQLDQVEIRYSHREEKERASMALAHRRPYGMYRWLAHTPDWLYQCGLGWLLGSRLMQITHRGRKSGKLRRTVLEVLHYDPQTREILVVSGWEGKTDWYRNIQQEPALQVCIGRVQYRPDQEFLSPEETAQLILTLFRKRPHEARLLGPLLGVDPNADEAHLRRRLSTFFRGVRFRPAQTS